MHITDTNANIATFLRTMPQARLVPWSASLSTFHNLWEQSHKWAFLSIAWRLCFRLQALLHWLTWWTKEFDNGLYVNLLNSNVHGSSKAVLSSHKSDQPSLLLRINIAVFLCQSSIKKVFENLDRRRDCCNSFFHVRFTYWPVLQ